MTKKKLSKKIISLIVCGAFLAFILLAAFGFAIAFWVADTIECWSPDYQMIELDEYLNKPELTEEDYDVLYAQTGLTKIGIDRALKNNRYGKERIKRIQKDFFEKHEVVNDKFAPYVCTDRLANNKSVTNIYLETGDIIVTSSTHISGFRIGHSGLVTNGSQGKVLQAMAYGEATFEGSITAFTSRVNYMVFRVKTDEKTKADVAEYAKKSFIGVPYDGTVGVFSSKDTMEKTQCAHLVWQAYKHFDIDLDSNGGLIVTPYDLTNSDQVELVQVFGFDPVALWK